MRIILHLCIYFIFPLMMCAQNLYTIKVVDALTMEPIKHCIITSDDSTESFLTNEDGIVAIKQNSGAAKKNYFYPGYEKMSVSVMDVMQTGIIALKKISTFATENGLIANEKKVLNRFKKCRNLLKKAKILHSKAYLVQTCYDNGEPIELNKYYYNSTVKGISVVENNLKAGQFAFTANPDKLFLTLSNTKIFIKGDVFSLNEIFPATPFAVDPDQLHNIFAFNRKSPSAEQSELHITFEPIVQSGSTCSGEIIMDKDSKPLNIKINVRNTLKFPFKPVKDSDSISNVNIDLSYIFNPDQKDIQLKLVELDYSFILHSKTEEGMINERKIRSQVVLHFYDFTHSFWISNLIYYFDEYDAGYRAATLIPYDSLFWANNNSLIWSESQLKQIRHFEEDGVMFNIGEGLKVGAHKPDSIIQNVINYIQIQTYRWQTELYYVPPTDIKYYSKFTFSFRQYFHYPERAITREKIYSYKPNINIPGNIYLDLNQYGDTIIPTSHLLFMPESSNYYADGSSQSFAYFNIFMDIKELRRRRLIEEMEKLNTVDAMRKYCIKHWPKIYKEMKKIEKETKHGSNLKALAKWNEYLAREIGKDNFAFFGVGK